MMRCAISIYYSVMSGIDARYIAVINHFTSYSTRHSQYTDSTLLDQQGNSYARPTAVGSYDLPHSRRSLPVYHSLALSSNASAFATLSGVAMDELHALERQEALRRAEYEARHAETLRRAEFQARHTDPNPTHGQISRSANTSPIPAPLHPGNSSTVIGDERSFGFHERDWYRGPGVDKEEAFKEREREKKGKRRSDGPTWHAGSASHHSLMVHSHSSGHLVDTPHVARGGHAHGPWSHPYHHSNHPMAPPHQHRNLGGHHHDDSPSPISSDSESLPVYNPSQSPPQTFHMYSDVLRPSSSEHSPKYSGMRTTAPEFSFTPSTSPFLGPLRTLNLHSANGSRVPSPTLMLPNLVNHGVAISPTEDTYPRSRGTSNYGSPPSHGYVPRDMSKRKDLGSEEPHHLPHLFPHHPSYLSERVLPTLPTPQLSSGPSSGRSSPGSLSHPLGPLPHGSHAGPRNGGTSGTRSASSSRAPSPSPSPWSHPSAPQPPHRGLDGSGGHRHLAHSVRLAFAMSPVHPSPSLRTMSRPFSHATSQPHSGVSTPMHFGGAGFSSMPSSRSGSPPITLPPLKMASRRSSPTPRPAGVSREDEDVSDVEDDAMGELGRAEKEKVELPGFSQFEAASRPSSMDIRMAVEFTR